MESDSEITIEDTLETIQGAQVSDSLAKQYYKLSMQKNDPHLLDCAILCAQRTAQLFTPQDMRQRRYCFRLANYLSVRHRLSSQPNHADLDKAIQYVNWVDDKTAAVETKRDKAKRLAIGADCHARLYQAGREEEYSRALHAFDEALKAWQEVGERQKIARCLRDIGALYAAKFEKNNMKDLPDLDISIRYVESAIAACQRETELWSGLLITHIKLLEYRASYNVLKTGNYQAGVDTAKLLIDTCSPHDEAKGLKTNYQTWLGLSYLKLADFTKSKDDFMEGYRNLREAIEATPSGLSESKIRYDVAMSSLSRVLTSAIQEQEGLFEHIKTININNDYGQELDDAASKAAALQQLSDLQHQITANLITKAQNVPKAPEEDTEVLIERLMQEAEWYRNQYKHDKDRRCLTKAIEIAEKAIEAAESGNGIEVRKKAALYNTLGHYLADLCVPKGNSEPDQGLIERAVAAGGKAYSLLANEDWNGNRGLYWKESDDESGRCTGDSDSEDENDRACRAMDRHARREARVSSVMHEEDEISDEMRKYSHDADIWRDRMNAWRQLASEEST